MPPKKSIYRQAGAQHFQLVHRSVRDPLINDPEASKHVFRPIERGNEKTGVTLSDLEASVDRSAMRPNEGEAATYGITYDDSGYDYMQHLRPVGLGGADSMLLEAPKKQAKGKFKMPEDVLASKDEVSVHDVYAAQEAIPRELQGFQPDMDPHLRQVLEALSDDEFVDDEEEDGDVFGELLGSGQLDDGEEGEEFEFAEWGLEDDERTENGDGEREETWEDRFRAFKAAGGHPKVPSNGGWNDDDVDSAERSEMADTVGSLVNGIEDMMVRGGKKRHGKRGPSDASGMSMSSSNVYRNDNLRTLDDRFDAIERAYEMDDDEEWDEDDDVSIAPSYMSSMSRVSFLRGDEPTGGGPLGEAEDNREDFDDIMSDFLDNYEVVGRRMREAVGGTKLTGPEKLAVIRAALQDEEEGPGRVENRRRILDLERRIETGQYRDIKESIDHREVEPEAKWDVETILSTYTNTENIPGMIRLRSSAQTKERAMRRAEAAAAAEAARMREAEEEEEEGSGSETEREAKVTVARPKGEGAAERKARKAAVKAERAGRRAEKKAHTQTFGDERKRQLNAQKKAVGGGRAADKTVGSRGVVSLS